MVVRMVGSRQSGGMKKIRVKTRRDYSPHHAMMRIARNALLQARGSELAVRDSLFVAMTFAALAMESFANTAGDKVAREEPGYRVMNFAEKVQTLCRVLSVRWDKEQEPWATVVRLNNFRTRIVHGKPQLLEEETVMTVEGAGAVRPRWPTSKLEAMVTLGYARLAVEQVRAAEGILADRVPQELSRSLYGDSMYSEAIEEPPQL